MKYRLALWLLPFVVAHVGIAPAEAASMRCSTEHAACISFCDKLKNKSYIPVCVTNCHTAQSNCMRSGCWNNGATNHCGYLRK
ncbi:MAG TPA: hypothetical protein VFS63_15670 [Pseudolabrys sp.]|jgi:hypothetical protein|nr:hypothetical protein [Pseudolabrys sp.]